MTKSEIPPQKGALSRRPAAFSVDEQAAARPGPAVPQTVDPRSRRTPGSFDEDVLMTPDEEDPFLSLASAADAAAMPLPPVRRRGFSFVRLALGAFGVLLSLAVGLWTDQLIRDLFSRADWLGYTAIGVVVIGVLAVIIAVLKELAGMMRLNAVQSLKTEAEDAARQTLPAAARTVVGRLTALLAARPETAKGRATLKATEGDIVDGPHLIALAERELLGPLDRQARALILNASKRVSVVTAVSPRAVVDLVYVLFEAARLVRAMAELYGGRPGTLGMIRLMRDVVAHLAVTGSIAVGDSLVQQVLGHGLASKLSARFGEGVINGLMTARIGIAAMDLCRPLPFTALKRPGIGDFIGDLTPSLTGRTPVSKD